MKEVIERCNWLVNKCNDKAITPDVKDDFRCLLEQIKMLVQDDEENQEIIIKQSKEIERLNNIIYKAIEYIERQQKEWNECSVKDNVNLYMFETYLGGVSKMITIKEILKGDSNE